MRWKFFACLTFALCSAITLSAQDPKQVDPAQPQKGPGKGGGKGAGKGAPKADPNLIYNYGPDSEVHEGIPQGKWDDFKADKSEFYPNRTWEVKVYIPAQYDEKEPACLMVFTDGLKYANRDGVQKVPNVIDNLTHRKELPVTITIFIDPGSGNNRSNEYDTVSDKYVTFLEKEIMPRVTTKYNVRKDAAGHLIGGQSSGGICAFNAAWFRPDLFKLVHCEFGSFVNIRGGNKYPEMVRNSEKKPIRVWLQDGSNDMTNQFGSWPEANLFMAAALHVKGYDYKFIYGEGTHHGRHAATIMPDAFRWLWRDEVKK